MSRIDISIMGIINLTPDSFYDGGKWINKNQIREKIKKWQNAGVNYIDIGCESSRPGSKPVNSLEETIRLEKILDVITEFNNIQFSIDTYKPQIAKLALKKNFKIINDIYGGGYNGEMFDVINSYSAKIIIMHMKGNPKNMQNSPYYYNVIEEIISFFLAKIKLAKSKGLKNNQIILDPGIGFGKRPIDNDIILGNLNKFKSLGFPILIGCSRKSFLSINDDEPGERLATSIAAMTIAIINGANIIRVHDVQDAIKIKLFLERYLKSISKSGTTNEC